MYGVTPAAPEPATESLPWSLQPAKNGALTAQEAGHFLHSRYNPVREAEQAVRAVHKEDTVAAVFCSFGLGYAPIAYATLYPSDTMVIIEPSADRFFAALTACDWSAVFKAPNVVLAIQAGVDTVTTLIEKAAGGSFKNAVFFSNQACTSHAQDYYSALNASIERAKKKTAINTFTLEKFSRLWLRNSCRNLPATATCSGVSVYEGAAKELPALVLAAGPTLQDIVPHLAALKKRMIIICVDTALHSCLKAGVEPDFIILVDPQYYAWRHIAGLASPSSVLITESAAYPAVYRFPCRKIMLCASLFPLGKYFEKRLGSKGELAAGGSVSTTAWDFARLCGSRRIYMAGLDLGYPGLETHIRGSLFEEKLHTVSRRTSPAETGGTAALFGANMRHALTYAGGDILTDDRMQLFAWWFESKQQEYGNAAKGNIQTYALSPHSLCIPGLRVASVDDLLAEPERPQARASFFAAEPVEDEAVLHEREEQFARARTELISGMESLYQLARKGISICEEALDGSCRAKKGIHYYMQALESIDAQILQSEQKDIASLVFPTERQLEQLYAKETFLSDTTLASFQRSKLIYRELQKSLSAYMQQL